MYMHTYETSNPWHQDVAHRHIYNYVWCILYWCDWSLARTHALLRIANNRCDVTDEGMCNFLIWVTMVRQLATRWYRDIFTMKYETKNPLHLDYGTLIYATNGELNDFSRFIPHEIKRFQTRRSLAWNRFISDSSQVSIYCIKMCWLLIIGIASSLLHSDCKSIMIWTYFTHWGRMTPIYVSVN